jgi:hypothetical protein
MHTASMLPRRDNAVCITPPAHATGEDDATPAHRHVLMQVTAAAMTRTVTQTTTTVTTPSCQLVGGHALADSWMHCDAANADSAAGGMREMMTRPVTRPGGAAMTDSGAGAFSDRGHREPTATAHGGDPRHAHLQPSAAR